MIAAIRAFLAKYEIIGILLIVVMVFFSGWRAANIWQDHVDYQAAKDQIAARDKVIDNLQDEVKKQSDIGQEIARKNADLVDENHRLTALLDSTYDQTPANPNACIAPVRVQLLNQQRAAANSRRAR